MPLLPPSPDPLQKFVAQMANPMMVHQLFEDLPGIEFFLKDCDGRRLCLSKGILRRLGFDSMDQAYGKTDTDLFPAPIAEQYQRGDQQIIATGLPLIGLIELWLNPEGLFDWFVVNKYPVFSRDGEVIGIMGTLRRHAETSARSDTGISRVVAHIRAHFREPLRLADLARLVHLSERQLRRRFREELGLPIYDFLLKTRIHAAAEALLQSDTSVAELAQEFGFCDQSAFTRQFRQHLSFSPLQYRKTYRPPASIRP